MKEARPAITIETATTPAAFATGRTLIQEYADWLAVDLCFQGYDDEIADLDTVYGAPSGRFFLAMAGKRPAGCVGLRKMAAPGEGEVKRLYVRPDFRGLGLGKALMQRTIEAARQIGYRCLRFDTLPSRTPEAQAMYRRLGCVETPPYYHNPVEGVVFMRLDLDAAG